MNNYNRKFYLTPPDGYRTIDICDSVLFSHLLKVILNQVSFFRSTESSTQMTWWPPASSSSQSTSWWSPPSSTTAKPHVSGQSSSSSSSSAASSGQIVSPYDQPGAPDCSRAESIPHQEVDKYYWCVGGRPVLMQCESGSHYDHSVGKCTWNKNYINSNFGGYAGYHHQFRSYLGK